MVLILLSPSGRSSVPGGFMGSKMAKSRSTERVLGSQVNGAKSNTKEVMSKHSAVLAVVAGKLVRQRST